MICYQDFAFQAFINRGSSHADTENRMCLENLSDNQLPPSSGKQRNPVHEDLGITYSRSELADMMRFLEENLG